MSAALTLGGKKLGKQWSACCAAHDDKSPSLIIFEGCTGAVQIRCMARCEPIEIIVEIRWHEVADRLSLMPPPGERVFTVANSISPAVRVRPHVKADFAERLIDRLGYPWDRPGPVVILICLKPTPVVRIAPCPRRKPRASRRRRSQRAALGKSADPDGDGSRRPL